MKHFVFIFYSNDDQTPTWEVSVAYRQR